MRQQYLDKKLIREQMQKLRNSLSYEEVREKSKNIHEILFALDDFKRADMIMTYVSFRNEVDTYGIINELLKADKKVVVPVCNTSKINLIPSRLLSIDELSFSHFGLMEPKGPYIRPVNPEEIDIILVPGLAFDKNKNRLGFGKGYYDRFLNQVRFDSLKIALAFHFQILDILPVESWDVPMDMIITEKGIV